MILLSSKARSEDKAKSITVVLLLLGLFLLFWVYFALAGERLSLPKEKSEVGDVFVTGMESALRGDAGLAQGSFLRTGSQEPRREVTGPGSVAGALCREWLWTRRMLFLFNQNSNGLFLCL